MNPVLRFCVAAWAEGVDLIEVREGQPLKLIKHHFKGSGDKREYIGSNAMLVPTEAIELSQMDPETLATLTAGRLRA